MSQNCIQLQSMRVPVQEISANNRRLSINNPREVKSKTSQNPRRQMHLTAWNSEWDHSYKHRLNDELTVRRKYYNQRVLNEQSFGNYFHQFNKVPFETYVNEIKNKPKYQITLAQIRRNRKMKEFSLKKLVDDTLTQPHTSIEKQNLEGQLNLLENLNNFSPLPQKFDQNNGHFYNPKAPAIHSKSANIFQTTQIVNFRRFTANNLKSIIQKQKIQETKQLKPENNKLVMEIIELYKSSPVKTFLDQGIKPKFRLPMPSNPNLMTQSIKALSVSKSRVNTQI